MTFAEKKEFCRRLFEKVWNENKVELIDQFFTPNYQLNDPTFPIKEKGPDALRMYLRKVKAAFPDLHLKIEDQIAEGDKVVTYFTATGTHEGEFLGLAPTHKKLTLPGIVIQRFANERIAEDFALWDAYGFVRFAGFAVPTEPAFATR